MSLIAFYGHILHPNCIALVDQEIYVSNSDAICLMPYDFSIAPAHMNGSVVQLTLECGCEAGILNLSNPVQWVEPHFCINPAGPGLKTSFRSIGVIQEKVPSVRLSEGHMRLDDKR